MELQETEIKIDRRQSSEGTTSESEDDISLSSEEDQGSLATKEGNLGSERDNWTNSESRFRSTKTVVGQQNGDDLEVLKEEIDVDSSLYDVSDLEDYDSNSEISFTDVPALLTMEDEPTSKDSLAQLVLPESDHFTGKENIPRSRPVALEHTSTPIRSSLNKNTENKPPAVTSFSEPVTWNSDDTRRNANAKTNTPTSSDEKEVQTPHSASGEAMISNFSESRAISESNDSVLDTSTDGEGSGSSHKEVLIDYRRSLVRKDSNVSDPLSDNISATSSVDRDSIPGSYDSGLPTRDSTPLSKYLVVAAIDFGTTYSGYAFAFTRDPDSIHMMRRWEGGDPGVSNQKTPTTLLLTPDKRFHSFGFGARDFYHDLEPSEAKKYMYFEKFKMKLYNNEVR